MPGKHSEKVVLSISADKLRNVAGAFKGTSDPYAIVTLFAADKDQKPVVLGKTEAIKNTLNPQFNTVIEMDYEFGKLLHFQIAIYDEIRKAKTDKAMGSAVFEVGAILGSKGNVRAKRLKKGGVIFARIDKKRKVRSGDLTLHLLGYKLKNVEGMFSKSDPFFEIHAETAEDIFAKLVYRSKHIQNNLNPRWDPVTIDLDRLCNGDKDKAVRISVFDHEKSGKHVFMGSVTTSVNSLIAAKTHAGTGDLKSIDTSRALQLKKKSKASGQLVVAAAAVRNVPTPKPPKSNSDAEINLPVSMAEVSLDDTEEEINLGAEYAAAPTFVDYLSGGCEINTCVAIDFTGSNGDPRKPGTLHYIHRDGVSLNCYEKAITALVSILSKYDTDKLFPVYGFGAKYSGVVRHCFSLLQGEAQGLKGVLDSYRKVFSSGLIMSGPTVFKEVLQHAAKKARNSQASAKSLGKQAYTVLVLLTDGAVSDVEETRQALVSISDAPLSVVIVGVGNADFSAMQFLDDLKGPRDICQFVKFNAHAHSKQSLTSATLEEIPEQLVSYFQSKNIQPLQRLQRGGSILQDSAVFEDAGDDEEIAVSLDFGENGEVFVASGGLYDQTAYTNNGAPPFAVAAAVPQPYSPAAVAPMQPPTFGAPLTIKPPGQYENPVSPTATAQPVYIGAPLPTAPAYGQSPPATYGQAPVPGAPPAYAYPQQQQQQSFPVQLPPGVGPGMQLQVQNPTTGQFMVVSVPHGIPPGGTFHVPY